MILTVMAFLVCLFLVWGGYNIFISLSRSLIMPTLNQIGKTAIAGHHQAVPFR